MANNFLKDNEKNITRILLASAAYFAVIKPLLEKVNIIDTKEEKLKKAADLAAKIDTASGSSISPYSWAAFFVGAPKGVMILTDSSAGALAKKINEAFNYWNFGNQFDETVAYGVLDSLKTQSQFAWIARKYYMLYSQSLYDYLKQCLTKEEFTDFNTKLMSKPAYK